MQQLAKILKPVSHASKCQPTNKITRNTRGFKLTNSGQIDGFILKREMCKLRLNTEFRVTYFYKLCESLYNEFLNMY